MQNNQPLQYGKAAWANIEKIHQKTGHDYAKLFRDWLDLMLLSFLSATAKGAGNKQLHEEYEQQYLAIVDRYADKEAQGKRNIDYFAKAMAALVGEMIDTGHDVLGEIFMNRITHGERGQFFTPQPITQMMVQMLQPDDAESVSDPACGSGRMLLEAHKVNPGAHLFGTDIDERCAKICVINLFLFGCRATVVWGNTLTLESWNAWDMGLGWIFERDPATVVTQPTMQHVEIDKVKTKNQIRFDF